MMREITVREALNEALREEMARDERIFIIGCDIGARGGTFGVTKGLYEEFGPERIRETPISEAAIVGCALGSAITGMRPVAEIGQIDWITIAMDQIINQVAKLRYMFGGDIDVPIVIRSPGGGGRGAAAQHSQSLEAIFAHVPGLKVIMPSTPRDAKGLLKAAIRDNGPVIFIEHRMAYAMKGEVPQGDYTIPIGKGEIKREGRDVTIVATSLMVYRALVAADSLAKDGIEAEVVDPRSIYPLDIELIVESVKKTHKIVIVHEAPQRGGIGGEIASQVVDLAFDYLDAPPFRVGGLNVPMPYSLGLEKKVIPDAERIVNAAREVCNLKTSR